MRNKEISNFAVGRVSTVVLRLAWPMILAQLVSVLYNVIDRMFIGHLPDIGGRALTGLGVVFPFIAFCNAFAQWIGQGGSAYYGIERGRGNTSEAQSTLGNSCFLLLIASAGLMLLGYTCEYQLLPLFGSTPETFEYSSIYWRIYLLGTPFQLLSIGLNPFIAAQGFATTAMLSVMIGAVMNIGLDFLFISVLGFGVAGAAIATIVSQLCSAIWVVCFLSSKRSLTRLTLKYLKPLYSKCKTILSLGLANFFFLANDTLVQSVSNAVLLAYGSHIYVGIMTVIISIFQVFGLPVYALNNAVKPFLSFNYGAGKYDRLLEGMRFILVLGCSVALLITIIISIFPQYIFQIFTDRPEYLEHGVTPMRLYFVFFTFMNLHNIGQTMFTSLGLAKEAAFFSLLRKIFVIIPLTIILPRIFNWGVNGVFFAESLSQIIVGTICFSYMYHRIVKRIKRNQPLRD